MNRFKLLSVVLCVSGLSAVFLSARTFAASGADASAPLQPTAGPGGSSYICGAKKAQKYGEGDLEYWIFEPANPTPKVAPVVIFNHGWSAMDPSTYGGWIDHLVRRGNIVIFPRYQEDLMVPGESFAPNAINAVKNALAKLTSEPGHVKPNLDNLAAVGHSAGGLVAAGLAADGPSRGLPPIKAVMVVEPGKTWGPPRMGIPLADVGKIPSTTLLLSVFGDADQMTKDIDARRIYNESKKIPKSNKNLIELVSDAHGSPPLIASHFCPISPMGGSVKVGERLKRIQAAANSSGPASGNFYGSSFRREYFQRQLQRMKTSQPGSLLGDADDPPPTPNSINALDYYGVWKLFDGLTDAAFFGKNRQYALGNTREVRFMGKWSDGVPVKELKVVQ